MPLPKLLVDEIKENQVVLFLGAGASIGSIHPESKSIPTSQSLALLIADKFLGPEYRNRPLSLVVELAISESNLFSVQEFIASLFYGFGPADFHDLIPTFNWVSICTTNFDLIIERAYNKLKDRPQELVVFKKNGERIEERLRSKSSLPYYKLHGCITDTRDQTLPLILTPDQYVTHKKGRDRLFERVKSLAYEYTFLFIGSSLNDLDIRTILLDLSELGPAKPRSYLVTPDATPPEVKFWESKRIECIPLTFRDFMYSLNSSLPLPFRSLSMISQKPEHPIFKRFRTPIDIKPSESLRIFLDRDVDYISKEYKTTKLDPKAFYRGYFTDWSPIIGLLPKLWVIFGFFIE